MKYAGKKYMSEGADQVYRTLREIDSIVFDIAEQRELQAGESHYDRFVREHLGEGGEIPRRLGFLATGEEIEYDVPIMTQCAEDGTLIHVRLAMDVPINDNRRYYVVTSDVFKGETKEWWILDRDFTLGHQNRADNGYRERLLLTDRPLEEVPAAIIEPSTDPFERILREREPEAVQSDIWATHPVLNLSNQRIDVVRPGQTQPEVWTPVQSIQNQLALYGPIIGEMLLRRRQTDMQNFSGQASSQ
jgi:hypothetical protein